MLSANIQQAQTSFSRPASSSSGENSTAGTTRSGLAGQSAIHVPLSAQKVPNTGNGNHPDLYRKKGEALLRRVLFLDDEAENQKRKKKQNQNSKENKDEKND